MEPKDWLRKQLKGTNMGQMTCLFDITDDLLEARIKWLKRSNAPAMEVIRLAKEDMKSWRDELKITEEDEV